MFIHKIKLFSQMDTEQPSHQDSIQVLVRIKPGNDDEESVIYTGNEIKLERHTFAFDRIFPPTSQQQDIFLAVGKKLIAHTLEGYNSCIFVYGQTGSGKTHTMMGNNNGLMQRSFCELFSRIDRMNCTECIVTCSYYQLYNEQIIDLLDTRKDKERKNLNIRQDGRRGVFVQNLTQQLALNSQKLLQCLTIGMKNRHIGQTMMNRQSSRSHSIFTISLSIKLDTDGHKCLKTPKLHFVDLAGSERQKATQATGDRLKQAGNINKSLTTLGMVINALALASDKPKVHIPYRDSKLTCLLRDSLGGNSKTFIVATIANSVLCFQETLSTLNFANRAKMVKVKALVNEQSLSTNIQQYKKEIRQLKQLIAQLKSQKRVPSQPSTASESISSRNEGFDHKFEEITHKIQDLKSNMINSSMQSFMQILSKSQQKKGMVDESQQEKDFNEGNELIQYMASNHQLLKNIHSTVHEYSQLKQQIKSLESSRRINEMQLKTPSKFERDQYEQLLMKRQEQIKQLEDKIVSLKEGGLKKQLQNKDLRKKILSFESIKTEESDEVNRLMTDQVQLQKRCSELQLVCEIANQQKTRLMKLTQELQTRLKESKELYLYSEQKNENQKIIRHKIQANIKELNRKIQLMEQERQKQIEVSMNKIEMLQENILERDRKEEQLKSQIDILNETLEFNQRKIKEYSQKIHQNHKNMQEINAQKMQLSQTIMDMTLQHQKQQTEYVNTINQLTLNCSQLINKISLLQNDQQKINREKQMINQEYQLLKEQSSTIINQLEEQIRNQSQYCAELNATYDQLRTEQKKNTQEYELKIYSLQRNVSNLSNQLEILQNFKRQLEDKYQWQRQSWTAQNNRMVSQNEVLSKQKLQSLQKNEVYEKKIIDLESNIQANKNVVDEFEQLKKTYKEVIKQNYKLKGQYNLNSQSQNGKSQQLSSKVTFYQQKFRLMSIQYNKVQDTTKKLKQKELNLIKKLEFYEQNQKLKKIHTSSEAEEVKQERYKSLQLENDELKESLIKITNMYETRLQNEKKEDYTKRMSIQNQKYELTQREEKIRKKLESAIKNWNHAKENNCSGMSLDEMFVCWEKIEAQSRKKFQGIAKAIRRQQKLKSQNNFIIKQNVYLKQKIDSLQKEVSLNSLGSPRKMLKLNNPRGEDNQ